MRATHNTAVDPPTNREALLAEGHVRRIELTDTEGAGVVNIMVLMDVGVMTASAAHVAWRGQRVRVLNVSSSSGGPNEQTAMVQLLAVGEQNTMVHTPVCVELRDVMCNIDCISAEHRHLLLQTSIFCHRLHKEMEKKCHIQLCVNPVLFDEILRRKQVAFLDDPRNRFDNVAYYLRFDLRTSEAPNAVLGVSDIVKDVFKTSDFNQIKDPDVLMAIGVLTKQDAVCIEAVSWPVASSATAATCQDESVSGAACVICQDCEDGVLVCARPCGHGMHAACLQKLFCTYLARPPGHPEKNEIKCPMCRGVLCGVDTSHTLHDTREPEHNVLSTGVPGSPVRKRAKTAEEAYAEAAKAACAATERMLVKIQQMRAGQEERYNVLLTDSRFVEETTGEYTCFRSCLCRCKDCVTIPTLPESPHPYDGFMTRHTPSAAVRWLSNRVWAIKIFADGEESGVHIDLTSRDSFARIMGPWKLRESGGGDDGSVPMMYFVVAVDCDQLLEGYSPENIECSLKCILAPRKTTKCRAGMLVMPTIAETEAWKQNLLVMTRLARAGLSVMDEGEEANTRVGTYADADAGAEDAVGAGVRVGVGVGVGRASDPAPSSAETGAADARQGSRQKASLDSVKRVKRVKRTGKARARRTAAGTGAGAAGPEPRCPPTIPLP